jgi:hypothetical protein
MARKQNFDIFSGNDITLSVSLFDERTQNPLNIFGTQELRWQIGKRAANPEPLISKDLDDGITIVDAGSGLITIAIDADETEELKGIYQHELRIVNSAGKKITLMYGVVDISINLVNE